MMRKLFAIFIVSFAFASSQRIRISPEVTTTYGKIVGDVTPNAVAWRGIPFASPPVKNLRFERTQPPKPWSGTLSTKKYSPGCPQICTLPPIFCPNVTSEDCLYMNIFAPLTRNASTLLPVMLFIYGGANIQGDAGCPIYRGEWNANKTEVILVTFNYRTGALGFISYGDKMVGNYGLDDQRMAMKFVKENIAKFGGDPNRVTLFGESAGAVAVGVHLISPLSKGYFQKAIMESNPVAISFHSKYQSELYAAYFAGQVGCKKDDMACFKSLPLDKIVTAMQGTPFPNPLNISLGIAMPWDVTLDNLQAPMQLVDAFRAKKYQKMPIMIGTNSEEAVLFVYFLLHTRFVNLEYNLMLGALFGVSNGKKVYDRYPPTSWNPIHDNRDLMAVLFTDYLFTCPTRKLALLASEDVDTYLYQFDHALSFNQYGPNYQACVGHVCHGAELPFVFHSADQDGVNFTKEEEILSFQMAGYWANFAYSGDPYSGSTKVDIRWPKYNGKEMKSLNLSTPVREQAKLLKSTCDFWDSLGPNIYPLTHRTKNTSFKINN